MGESVVAVPLIGWLVALAGADHRTMRIPNRWVLPAVVAVAASGIDAPGALLAATLAASPYLLGAVVGHCGAGDAKLAFVVGGLTADPMIALVTVLAAQLPRILGAMRSDTPKTAAHGPALTSAATIVGLG